MDILFSDQMMGKKNLLGFSSGSDSSCLFFHLIEKGIDFDIAIVNYSTRETSDAEEMNARQLAFMYGKKCHVLKCSTEGYSNFEQAARKERYRFFHELIEVHGYENLVTGHHLNDRIEWMMMQMVRGTGSKGLAGMEGASTRVTPSGKTYNLVRPMIECHKEEINQYLDANNIYWFSDESNHDTSYVRNRFRKDVVNDLVREHHGGLRRTCRILEEEAKCLGGNMQEVLAGKDFAIYVVEKTANAGQCGSDILKRNGYVPSYAQREELDEYGSLIILKKGVKWVVRKISANVLREDIFDAHMHECGTDDWDSYAQSHEFYIFFQFSSAPYTLMRKAFQENRVPMNIRGFLYVNSQLLNQDILSQKKQS